MHQGSPDSPPNSHAILDSSASSDIKAILTHSELLSGVPQALLDSIASKETTIALQPGQVLLSPEHDNRYLYIVLSGSLGIHFGSLASTEIRMVGPGTCVGEMSIIDHCRPSAYVVAHEPSVVFPVHSAFLQQYLIDTNPIVSNLLKVLTRWIRENTECMLRKSSKIVELTNHASTDALTGLFNRRWLDNSLPHFLAEASETGQPLCLLLLDVDHFKNYNDSHGHTAGDQALKIISNTLKNAIRPQDFATRYGGEEFLILLPHTNQNEGVLVAERIRHAIEELSIIGTHGGKLPKLTISIGLAVSQADATPKSLFDSADAKLYKAKQEGRNCIRYDEAV